MYNVFSRQKRIFQTNPGNGNSEEEIGVEETSVDWHFRLKSTKGPKWKHPLIAAGTITGIIYLLTKVIPNLPEFFQNLFPQ